MNDTEERIATWNYMHKEKNLGALSGCQYQETLNALKIKPIVPNFILEIGVGMGYVTEGFKNNGFHIDAFDISSEALNRVRHFCNDTYGLYNIGNLMGNYYDLVICRNVVQHIPTPLLYFELFHFIRALTPNGVMAVKSVFAKGYEDTGDDPDLVINGTKCSNSIGCFCRSEDTFKKIVDRCGGVAELIIRKPCNVMFITEEHIFHIKKKSYD